MVGGTVCNAVCDRRCAGDDVEVFWDFSRRPCVFEFGFDCLSRNLEGADRDTPLCCRDCDFIFHPTACFRADDMKGAAGFAAAFDQVVAAHRFDVPRQAEGGAAAEFDFGECRFGACNPCVLAFGGAGAAFDVPSGGLCQDAV